MSILLRIVVALAGICLFIAVHNAMIKANLSAAQSLVWLFSGFLLIIFAAFPGIVPWIAKVFGVSWPPAILMFFAIILIGFICLKYAKELSVLRAQVTELTEQVSVMKHELQEKQIISKGKREE